MTVGIDSSAGAQPRTCSVEISDKESASPHAEYWDNFGPVPRAGSDEIEFTVFFVAL